MAASKDLLNFKMLLRSVLIPNKDGLVLTAVEDEFTGMTGERIPYRQLGFNTLLQLLESMPELATISRVNGHIQVR